MAKKDLSKAPSSNLLKKITKSGNANANSKTTMDIEVSLIEKTLHLICGWIKVEKKPPQLFSILTH